MEQSNPIEKPKFVRIYEKFDKGMSPYCCPVCGWNYPMEDAIHYVIKKGRVNRHPYEITNFHKFNETTNELEWNKDIVAQITQHIYPRYLDQAAGYDGSKNWTETHKCPKCNREFEIENGT